jgi:uncharacterized protein
MSKRYFPQGIATDSSFCNREKERASLKTSIVSHEHIVLVAPRRYGKTSLLAQVLNECESPGVSIDFFFVLSQAEATKHISEGVSQIISKMLPKTKTACDRLISKVKAINPKLTISLLGQKVEISTKQSTEKSISELLLALDHFADKANMSCVVVLDEFQQIGELKENHAIEAAIRHAVERSKHVSYIFCGSKRHLLNEMFSDKSRPLYHLCDLMTINRIETACYQKFLNEMARKRWRKSLSKDIVIEITELTENHPYYVNALCRRLWHNTAIPTIGTVRSTWADYVDQQSPWIITDISGLTLNRRKVITALALQPTNEPQGQEFSARTGLNPSGIKKSLTDLEKLDLVYKDGQGYRRVLDPVIAYFIRQNT